MMNKKTIRKLTALILVLMLGLIAQTALAEENVNVEAARKNAIAALKVSMPEAEVNYAVREHDDGRVQWHLFFTQGGSLGMCKIDESSNAIRKVELYEMKAGMLTADKAVDALVAEKGPMTITELEIDRKKDEIRYEGDADVNGKRYEFEITSAGRIIEWERD